MPIWLGLLCGLGVVCVCAGVGRLLLGRWEAGRLSLGERWALFGWTGMTLLAYGVLFLGLCGLLRWQWILALVALWIVIGTRDLVHLVGEMHVTDLRAQRLGWTVFLWGMIAICILFAATGAVHPPITNEYDSLTYHLAAPKLYLEAGEVYRILHDYHTNSPLNLEMLYTIGLAFGSEAMAKSFHFAVYLLLIASVAGAAKRLFGNAHGSLPALAASIVGTLPPIVWEAGTAYVDLGMALGMWLGLVCLIGWWCSPHPDPHWLWLSGVASGTAMATKVLGGIVLLFTLVALGAAALRRRRVGWRSVAGFLALAALFGGPWYVRAWVYTGNPIYPYAYSLLGGVDWDADCARNYREDQLRYGFGRIAEAASRGEYRPTTFVSVPAETAVDPGPVTRVVNRLFAKGRPPVWWGLPLVPLFATFDGAVFWERPMVVGIIGPLFLAFLPALWLARPLPPSVRLCLAFAAFMLCVWWFTTQLTRYLIPALVALSLPTALGITRLMRSAGAYGRLTAVLASVGLTIHVLCGFVMWTGQAPFAFGSMSRTAAIASGFEMYPLFQAVNTQLGPSDKVALYGEPRGYYLEVPYLWADFGYHTLLPYREMADADDLLDAYRRLGVTAVLINKDTARSTYLGTDAAGRLIHGLIARGHLKPMAETPRGIVYRIDEAPESVGTRRDDKETWAG